MASPMRLKSHLGGTDQQENHFPLGEGTFNYDQIYRV